MTRRKFAYALTGFILGIYTLPLGLLLWPLGLAFFLANEADDCSADEPLGKTAKRLNGENLE